MNLLIKKTLHTASAKSNIQPCMYLMPSRMPSNTDIRMDQPIQNIDYLRNRRRSWVYSIWVAHKGSQIFVCVEVAALSPVGMNSRQNYAVWSLIQTGIVVSMSFQPLRRFECHQSHELIIFVRNWKMALLSLVRLRSCWEIVCTRIVRNIFWKPNST